MSKLLIAGVVLLILLGCTRTFDLGQVEKIKDLCKNNGGVDYVEIYVDDASASTMFNIRCVDGAEFNQVAIKFERGSGNE